MLLSHRRRQRTYAVAGASQHPNIRKIVTAVVILFIVYWAGSKILGWFGVGNPRERSAVTVQVDSGSSAEVSLDGNDWQHAENGMKIYWDDAVRTGAATRVTLGFFEGTRVRLDESSELSIYDSAKGRKESTIALVLKRGSLFVDVPEHVALSGSIIRTIEGPQFTYTLVPGTKAFIAPTTLLVFRAEGQGMGISARKHDAIVIGEGQKWVVGSGALQDDLYAYRSPLDAATARNAFVTESQTLFSQQNSSSSSAASLPEGEFLTLSEPAAGDSLEGSTLTIRGKVTKDVARVEVNGRDVPIDEDGVSFAQTMVPPDGTDDIVVEVQAFDPNGTLLSDIKRTVKRLPVTLTPPSIDAPAKTGETYRTQKDEFVLRGTAPRGATGIMVNDYLLQLFDPSKGTWSYLAALRLGNLKEGANRFDVYALYPGPGGTQRKSDAATVTILIEEGPVGVVSTSSAGSAGSSASSKPVLNNPPLKPGSLAVIAPAAGTSATVTGTGTLIEGTTIRETDTLWVNDYRLQLYKPGKLNWNYIASPDIKNLKRGKNTFVIISRNAKGEVLDKMEYVIEYQP
jgi:hypothetical protein